jgi:hypothetical protein
VPSSGSIYQLSQVYSSYGYEPKGGERISAADTIVTGSNNRVYYKRPTPDSPNYNKVSLISIECAPPINHLTNI